MSGNKTGLQNVFTVDLEEWFQGLTSTNPLPEKWPALESRVEKSTGLLLDILRVHRVKATFFVLGYVADRKPALIEQIYAEGHEIGIHGYFHRFVSRLNPDKFAWEVDASIQAVQRLTGEFPWGHRAPYFSINAKTPWAFEILQRAGLRYDSSVFPVRSLLYNFSDAPRFPYCVSGSSLVEFPVSTVRLGGVNWPVAGGIYLRTLPYAFLRWSIARLNLQGQAAIIYVHPHDLDVDQRYYQVTPRERVTHYIGRRTVTQKLHRLFGDFRFGPLRALLERQIESSEQGGSGSLPN